VPLSKALSAFPSMHEASLIRQEATAHVIASCDVKRVLISRSLACAGIDVKRRRNCSLSSANDFPCAKGKRHQSEVKGLAVEVEKGGGRNSPSHRRSSKLISRRKARLGPGHSRSLNDYDDFQLSNIRPSSLLTLRASRSKASSSGESKKRVSCKQKEVAGHDESSERR
jgi:hypothetical protein